jgi:hypothetical protein
MRRLGLIPVKTVSQRLTHCSSPWSLKSELWHVPPGCCTTRLLAAASAEPAGAATMQEAARQPASELRLLDDAHIWPSVLAAYDAAQASGAATKTETRVSCTSWLCPLLDWLLSIMAQVQRKARLGLGCALRHVQ